MIWYFLIRGLRVPVLLLARRITARSCSSAESHFAVRGELGKTKKMTRPQRVVMAPSTMNTVVILSDI